MKRWLERLRVRRSITEELEAHLEEKAAALMESGAQMIASGRIPMPDVMAALDETE